MRHKWKWTRNMHLKIQAAGDHKINNHNNNYDNLAYSLCLSSDLCDSWRMAGLKGDGGRTGDCEDFSSLTPTTLDLCSYRHTRFIQVIPLKIKTSTVVDVVHSHVSCSVMVTAVPLTGTEASEENASSAERGSHASILETQEEKYYS